MTTEAESMTEAEAIKAAIDVALRECLISPNELDRNWEAANVVDGLFAIARALDGVAEAIAGTER